MQTGPLFNVGGNQVDRREVNPELIARMADSAKAIHTEGNASPEAWQALSDRVSRDDRVSEQDLKQIQDLGRACFTYHKKLHARFRDSQYKDRAAGAELADVHVFLSGADRVKAALLSAQARVAVQALAGASFGPTGLVTAYAAQAHLAEADLKPLMGELQEIRDGDSHLQKAGNRVEGFHREEIWPEMITMLDQAAADARQGRPVEVDAQYYELTNQEIVGKLAQAAEAGCKVRVNVDAGRLVAFKGSHVEIDEVPDKLRSLLQLAAVKGDVGVSAYPVPRELGDPGDLMHRKGLRVGDSFLLSGMNANEGSGENVDAGYRIEGPAARQLGLNFARDVALSAGASNADVYGEKALAEFMGGDINMGTRGLVALMDCRKGPAPAGTSLPRAHDAHALAEVARSYGESLSDYVDLPLDQVDERLSKGEQLPLNAQGKQRFLELVDRALGATRAPANLARLKDIEAPSGEEAGKTRVTLADVPTDREAVMLTAIQDAEEFVYIPAFVMTRSVASMLVARRDELKEQGRDLDVRVLVDPGVYPDGGTPNEYGVKFLEDAGIPVRWANLPRSGWHDRKIHAKEILTDRGEFFGSTNFSNKGLRENWEHSGYVSFDLSDPDQVAERDQSRAQFIKMWDRESFDLNSLEKGRRLRDRQRGAKDFEVQADEARYGVVRDIIRGIEKVEQASGAFVEGKVQDPKVAARVAELVKEGHDEGSARLMAVEESMGTDAFYAALDSLPERQELDRLR